MNKHYYFSFFFIFIISSTATFAQVDYETQIQSIFTAKCNSCHGNGQNTFNSSSYEAVMASTSAATKYNKKHVIPGDADGSPLVDKIEANPQFGTRMPQGGSLPQSEINAIKQWISEGANAVPTNNESEYVIPESFKLLGNYPNPFNPSTHIQFDVPVAAQYTISIYTMHGQLIAEQVGNVAVGRAQIPINLAGNPTGIYLYKVSALTNSGTQIIGTGRMTLVK
ncbi:MAG: T9SS type A sorting domain-containing protein [Balneolaceae bacterium]